MCFNNKIKAAMSTLTIEIPHIEELIKKIENIDGLIQTLISEQRSKDPYLTNKEAAKYLGYGSKWLEARKEDIGFYQAGGERRFKRSDIDNYMNKHLIQRKYKI